MFKSFLITALTLGLVFVTTSSIAEELTAANKLKFRSQAQDFYLQQAMKQQQNLHAKSLFNLQALEGSQILCDDNSQNAQASCVSVLCQFNHCSESTSREIAEVCRGSSGSCVQELCKTSHCSGSTGREIATSCRGSSGLCVQELCKTSHCSGPTGREIAQACEGADGQCVVELCKTTHCSGSTGKGIARSCSGR